MALSRYPEPLSATLLVLFALSLGACGGASDGDDDDDADFFEDVGGGSGGDEGSDDGGSDDGGSDDGGSDDGGDDGAEDRDDDGHCPLAMGLHDAGRTWRYETTPDYADDYGVTEQREVTVASVTAHPDYAEVVTVYAYDRDYGSGNRATIEGTVHYRCDITGVWLEEREEQGSLTWSGHTDDIDVRDVMDGYLLLPADLSPGVEWETSYTQDNYVDGAFYVTTEHEGAWIITGPKAVTVPAGTFEALIVESTGWPEDDRAFSPEVGLLTDGMVALVDWVEG